MSYAIVGACPRCGAPVYAPMQWNSVNPPPSTPSCQCFPQAHPAIATNTGTKP